MADCVAVMRRCVAASLLAASGSAAADSTPDAFDFTNVAVPYATAVVSNVVTLSGIDEPTAMTLSGHATARFRVNSGAWQSAPYTVNAGDRVQLRLTSLPTRSPGSRAATVSIGGVSDQWRVTTSAGVPPRVDQSYTLGGTSPGLPCGGTVRCVGAGQSLQAAIDAASGGDTLQVAAGTYVGNFKVGGKRLTLLGGFPAGDFSTRRPIQYRSILRGAGNDSVITFDQAGASVLDGFVIRGGTGNSFYGGDGGGVFVHQSDARIAHNLIESNQVCGPPAGECRGGGIYLLDGGAAVIAGNIVRNNRAARGAGIASNGNGVSAKVLTIADNLVEDNYGTSDHGGGLYLFGNLAILRNLVRGNSIGLDVGYGWGAGITVVEAGGLARLANNRVTGNNAASIGAAIFIDEGATAELFGDVVHDNVCDSDGAALYVDGSYDGRGSTVRFDNLTVARNGCTDGATGRGLFVEGGSTVTVAGSIFQQNTGGDAAFFDCVDPQGQSCVRANTPTTLDIRYSRLTGFAGTGNFTGNPAFVDAAAGDFHLGATSAAIDRADPAVSVGPEPAPNGGRRNAGAYGGTREAAPTP